MRDGDKGMDEEGKPEGKRVKTVSSRDGNRVGMALFEDVQSMRKGMSGWPKEGDRS